MTAGRQRKWAGLTPTEAANPRAKENSLRSGRNAVRLVRLRIHVRARERVMASSPAATTRRRGRLIALVALAGMVVVLGLAMRASFTGRRLLHRILVVHAEAAGSAVQSRCSEPSCVPTHFPPRRTKWMGHGDDGYGDRFGDGTPDFARLTDPADQAAFRRWFTLIAEYKSARPQADVPVEITDCASLLRFSYREALKRHDESWFQTTGIQIAAPPGEIRAWNYPHSPLGTALFRVKPGVLLQTI